MLYFNEKSVKEPQTLTKLIVMEFRELSKHSYTPYTNHYYNNNNLESLNCPPARGLLKLTTKCYISIKNVLIGEVQTTVKTYLHNVIHNQHNNNNQDPQDLPPGYPD